MRRFLSVPHLCALACCALFVSTGTLWLSDVGIETDEALFSAVLYPPFHDPVRVFHRHVPVMVMTYVGGLKGWLYAPLLTLLSPTVELVRIPVVLLGGLTVWLFYLLLRRFFGAWGAVMGTALLATDPVYLMTTKWDWGPVAIQHFCLVAAALCLVRSMQNQSLLSLGGGFFLLGLGLWDKATFIWLLAGGGMATLLVLPRLVRRELTVRNALIAVCSFCLGASPLLRYNWKYDWATFRANGGWSAEGVADKALSLKTIVEGAAMFGFAVRADAEEGTPLPPGTSGRRMVVDFNNWIGSPLTSLQWELLIFSVALLPLYWRIHGRLTLFTLIFVAVALCLMAFTRNGGAVHHLILLWPAPQILIAAAFDSLSRFRRSAGLMLAAATTMLVAASNLAVTTTYLSHQIVNGSSALWSDAAFQIPGALAAMGAEQAILLDWDLFDNTRLMMQGKVKLRAVDSTLKHEELRSWIVQPEMRNVFIWHTPRNEMQPETAAVFRALLSAGGYRKYDERILYDRNGRPIIELFRVGLLHPAANP